MKNLLLVLLLSVVFMSCNQEKSWYEQGHIDPDNECTFIVNESIQVVGEEYISSRNDNDVKYYVVVNGERLPFRDVGTFHTIFIHRDKFHIEKLFGHLEREYNDYIAEPEPVKCFVHER